jgi:hypothetical protein
MALLNADTAKDAFILASREWPTILLEYMSFMAHR